MSELVDRLIDGRNTRSTVNAIIKTLEDHNARLIPIPANLAASLPLIVAKLLQSDSPRIKASAIKLAISMLRHNMEVVATADKMSRLDNNQATERVECPVKLIEGISPKWFETD